MFYCGLHLIKMDNIIFIHGNIAFLIQYLYHIWSLVYNIWKYLFVIYYIDKIFLNKINIKLKLFTICNKKLINLKNDL